MKTRNLVLHIRAFIIVLATVGAVSLARSQGSLSWGFDSTSFVVQPTDDILLTATISNSSSSPFVINAYAVYFTGALQFFYDATPIIDIGGTVPADGTLQFNFINLTPIGGFVPPGLYSEAPPSNQSFFDFFGTDGSDNFVFADNFFQITVLPEPSNVSLAGTGLLCLLFARRRRGFTGKS